MPSLYLYGSREKEGFLFFSLSLLQKKNRLVAGKTGSKNVQLVLQLLPNELKSGVARFTTNIQTDLAINQVVADCGSSCKK